MVDALTARSQQADFDVFLKEAHHTALAQALVYTLVPGDCLLLPFGSVATVLQTQLASDGKELVIPRKRKHEVRTAEEYGAYAVFAPFDIGSDKDNLEETQKYVLQSCASSHTRIPLKIRQHVDVVKWREQLESTSDSAVPSTEGAVSAP